MKMLIIPKLMNKKNKLIFILILISIIYLYDFLYIKKENIILNLKNYIKLKKII